MVGLEHAFNLATVKTKNGALLKRSKLIYVIH